MEEQRQDTNDVEEQDEGEISQPPIMNGVRWSAGFIRTWISALSEPTSSQNEVEAADLNNYAGGQGIDTCTILEPPINPPLPPLLHTYKSSNRSTVRAIFSRSFLQSITAAQEHVSRFLENGAITSSMNKYGRQTPRVSESMYSYYRHYSLTYEPDISLSTAIWSINPSETLDGMTQEEMPSEDDIFLVSEEIYETASDNLPSRNLKRHNFLINQVEPSELPRLQSEGALNLVGEQWRKLNVADMTYWDYFLAFDEQQFTTLLNFIARLHIITSPSYSSVVPDGRLFLADSIAMIYSPYDSHIDSPGLSRARALHDFPKSHPEYAKGLEPVVVHGPHQTKVETFLATPSQIRGVMLALEKRCREKQDPKMEYNWSIRCRNYMAFTLPGLSKAAIKLAIDTCQDGGRVNNIKQAIALNDLRLEKDFTVTFPRGSKTDLMSPAKHFMASGPILKDPIDHGDPDEHVLCSIRVRIGSDYCGCDGPWFVYDDRHTIGFDFTMRTAKWSYAKSLFTELGQLFHNDLISLSLGQDASKHLLHTSSMIAFCLRELDLVQDANFSNEKLNIVDLGAVNYDTSLLFVQACGYKPVQTLHKFVMSPLDQQASFEQDAEVSIAKLATLSIACAAAAVFQGAKLCQGRRASVLESPILLKNSFFNVVEASMVVNVLLKALSDANYGLLTAVLGTVKESYTGRTLGTFMQSLKETHPLIYSCTPESINKRNKPPCGCVICVAVSTTQLNGTWRTDLIRPDLLGSQATAIFTSLVGDPLAGAVNLVTALTLAKRPFICQRNSNFLLHNQPTIAPDVANDYERGNPEQFDTLAANMDNTKDEILEAYWSIDNEDASCRIHSAMIIGSQSTNPHIESPSFTIKHTTTEPSSTGEQTENPQMCHATFTWPGWLCSLIIGEAHERVPAGTAHWAAVSAVSLYPIKDPSSPVNQLLASMTLNPEQPAKLSLSEIIPSKNVVIQPHPVYNWPLHRQPKNGEVVILDLNEKKRICIALEDISALKSKPKFVSHIWETSRHPDPTGRQMSRILRRCEGTRYMWLDYTCLPQGRRNKEERARFQWTLMQLPEIQSRMETVIISDEYDRLEWERRGWCIVEAIIGNISSPFAQSVFTHFRRHQTLDDIFRRLRIHVTNMGDVKNLETVLHGWLRIVGNKNDQQESDLGTRTPISTASSHILLSTDVSVPPPHRELNAAKTAAALHRSSP